MHHPSSSDPPIELHNFLLLNLVFVGGSASLVPVRSRSFHLQSRLANPSSPQLRGSSIESRSKIHQQLSNMFCNPHSLAVAFIPVFAKMRSIFCNITQSFFLSYCFIIFPISTELFSTDSFRIILTIRIRYFPRHKF